MKSVSQRFTRKIDVFLLANSLTVLIYLFLAPLISKAQLTSRIDCYLPLAQDSTECKLVIKRPENPPSIYSTMVLDGHAVFVIDVAEPCPAYIWIENRKKDVNLFIDSADIRITFNDHLTSSPQVKGSLVTELWTQQASLLAQLVEKHTELSSQFEFSSTGPNDLLSGNSLPDPMERMDQLGDSLHNEYAAVLSSLIATHPKAISSWYLYRSRFLAFSYQTRNELFAKLSSFRKYTSYRKIQRELIANQVGQKALNFELPTLSEKRLSLADIKGKYILLDFTSSHVPSNKRRRLVLRKLYERYHSQGFEIITISREFDGRMPKTALLEEKLPWPVVMDLDGNTEVHAIYQIGRLPVAILLNSSKKIVAQDIQIRDLEERLGKLLAQ
ncbi:hypothetical protein GCM10027592_58560 [Spirosoma flavus]